MIVFDEAHHSPAPSYRKLLTNLRQKYPNMRLLGLTATPTYNDLKKQGWLKELFPADIIFGVSPQKLIAAKILAQPVLEEPQTELEAEFDEAEFEKWTGKYRDLPEDIIDRLARNRERNTFIVRTYLQNKERYGKTIIFADRWFQCEQLREMLEANGVRTGVMYSHIDADPGSAAARNKRTQDENAKELHAFKSNQLDVLINVRMLTEGTDVPDIQTVFLTRQTTSQILLTQMVGRALRGPEFGGTSKAYIVSFIDNWKHAINWADPRLPLGGGLDETESRSKPLRFLQLVSIELARALARDMGLGNTQAGSYLSNLPIGWYQVEFEARDEENKDDTEPVRQLVMVFEDQKDCYEVFIQHLLTRDDLEEFGNEATEVDLEENRGQIESWQQEFFPSAGDFSSETLLTNLFYLARHIVQAGDGKMPQFFPFEERDNHDLAKIARELNNQNVGVQEVTKILNHEYERADRYWNALYPSIEQFHLRGITLIFKPPSSTSAKPLMSKVITSESAPPRGPSEEVIKLVKERDKYQCLCCGYALKRWLDIEHVIPRLYGDLHEPSNLQTLCRTCNRAKGTDTIDFRLPQITLTSPRSDLPSFVKLPSDVREVEEWEKYLRRIINFFYRYAAVENVKIGQRGQYFYEWQVSLRPEVQKKLFEPHLKELVRVINQARGEAGLRSIRSINLL